MKAKNVARVLLAAVAVLVLSSYGSSLSAFNSEVMYYYYTGCDENLTLVGSRLLTCDLQVIRDGQQGGWFMELYETECDTGQMKHSTWEYCSGSWRAANLGECGCSH